MVYKKRTYINQLQILQAALTNMLVLKVLSKECGTGQAVECITRSEPEESKVGFKRAFKINYNATASTVIEPIAVKGSEA